MLNRLKYCQYRTFLGKK